MNCLNKNYTKGLESLMDNSISQKAENTKRYLPHDLKTKENAVKTGTINEDVLHNLIFRQKSANNDPENSDMWLLNDEPTLKRGHILNPA